MKSGKHTRLEHSETGRQLARPEHTTCHLSI